MNRRLRIRHRRTLGLLTVLVPVGFAAALSVRAGVPEMARVPHPTSASPDWPAGTVEVLDSVDWRARFDARLASDGRRAVLELRPLEDWELPDLLVYWTEVETDAPGPSSVLIGKLAGTQRRRFVLPSTSPGWITIFSLGHEETVFRARVGT